MADLIDQILTTFRSQDLLEYAGLAFGVIYVILAANNKIICWVFGIISCFAIAIKDFFDYQLYSDGLLQIFYIIMGFVGLYLWRYGNDDKTERSITIWNLKKHLPYILTIFILTWGIGFGFNHYTDAEFPYLDALTSVMSVYATFLLVYRIWDNWIVWVVADLIYVYLYFAREAYFFSLLMILYSFIAVFGLMKWKKEYSSAQSSI
jgi:nicotinamide mononucleotide transporter